jgi:hypothetical protein
LNSWRLVISELNNLSKVSVIAKLNFSSSDVDDEDAEDEDDEDAEDEDDEDDDLMGNSMLNAFCSTLERMLLVSSTVCGVALLISTPFTFKNSDADTRIESD